jgi:hypothetical protein
MLTYQEDVINVCQEENVAQIEQRYMEFNKHAQSYTWKALINDQFVKLDMKLTLSDNGIPDESENFEALGLDEDFFVPTFHIYFNDDLTYA